ncbi:MAG: AI-2E family transporter [Defluviitaleaceae bacterium]|nr:AI-2E family transporter [Defluviitaleaceae bacterium]MCL2263476.1 AI-2E family transporter [Defluviitaleaceae bacterium]
MQKFFKSRLLRSMVPYFLLGVLLIIAFRVITGIGFFAEHLGHFWGVVTPFFIGGVIAYILNLPCSAIQRIYQRANHKFLQKRSRGLSVLSLFIIIIALLVLAFNFVIPTVLDSIETFIEEIENYEETFRDWIATVDSWNLPFFEDGIDEELVFAMLSDFIVTLDTEGVAISVMAGFGATARALFNSILIIISSIYFLIDKDNLKGFLKNAISALSSSKTNDTVLKYSRKLNHNFHMYIYTQTIDGIILGSLMTVLLILFGSPHALLLGLILGFVNYIPYFGSIFGTIFAIVVVAFTQGIPTAAVAGIFMFILQQVDGNFIQPKLMGGSFSLSPLLVIISVTIGMAYGGILGMLVAIPIVAILKDLVDEYIAYREELKRNPPPPPVVDPYA